MYYVLVCRQYPHSVECKAIPLQAWTFPEGSRKLRLPDFVTTAQDVGKVVSLTHRPLLPPGNSPGTHFCSRLRAIVRSEGIYVNEWDRTSDLLICNTAP